MRGDEDSNYVPGTQSYRTNLLLSLIVPDHLTGRLLGCGLSVCEKYGYVPSANRGREREKEAALQGATSATNGSQPTQATRFCVSSSAAVVGLAGS